MAGINNLLCIGNEILNHENCNKHKWKTQEGDLLKTLKFYNINLALPFPTIYTWIGLFRESTIVAFLCPNPQSLWIWQNGLIFFSKLPAQSSHTHMPSKGFWQKFKGKKMLIPSNCQPPQLFPVTRSLLLVTKPS
jgi:hypothetical protein